MSRPARRTRTVAVFVFDEVEVLDLGGPFEVFWTAARVARRIEPDRPPPFDVRTVAATRLPVRARGGLVVTPSDDFASCPDVDVLVVPGGVVTAELAKPDTIAWIAERSRATEVTAAVCTGAFLLGAAGLLDRRRATTHWEDVADLRAAFPNTEVVDDLRWVDEGAIQTSAGISAGIDSSLHLVARLESVDLARATARQMEYDWNEDPRAR
ncbi:MAG: DJ-1/PfpI family protein [Planctomycetota bacterium]